MTWKMQPIKKRDMLSRHLERIFFSKGFLFTFTEMLIQKIKNNFQFKAFLQYREHKLDKNILNS